MTIRSDAQAPVWLYHRVQAATHDPFGLCVTPDVFERQMAYLRRQAEVLPLNVLVAHLDAGTLPPRATAITFDDGYVDNLLEVAPILEAFQLPATFFVTTDHLDTHYRFWWDDLGALILRAPTLPDRIVVTDAKESQLHWTTDGERLDILRAIHRAIFQWSPDACAAAVAEIGAQLPAVAADAHAVRMTGPEICALANRPAVSVGSHTVRHAALAQQSPEICQWELRESRRALESLVGKPVTSVAYPFGAYADRVAEAASDAGYAVGLTLGDVPVGPHHNRLALPRVEAPSTLEAFAARADALLDAR